MLLYVGSAVFALCLLRFSPLLKYRTWADFAVPTYTAAALAAAAVAVFFRRSRRRAVSRARVLIAFAVLCGTLAAPLVAEVAWRAERGTTYAPSEVVVTEVAARVLVHGGDPYKARLDSPELAGRAPSIAQHFPYLPGMMLFGLPRALAPNTRWSDARLWLALATLLAAAVAVCRWRVALDLRLRLVQVLLVPLGAAVLVAGGNDVLVLALCFCALVLFARGNQTGSAAAIALAASLKLTAWPLLLALAIGSRSARSGKTQSVAFFAALLMVGSCVVAGLAAGAEAFADDVLLFPFGLTSLPSPAATTTLGSMAVDGLSATPLSATRIAAIAMTIAVGWAISAGVLRWLVRLSKHRPARATEIAGTAGVMLAILIVLAPQARLAYLIYPVDFLVWAALMRSDRTASDRAEATAPRYRQSSEGFAW